MSKEKIFVINGPNLNMLGERENDIYGAASLEDIEKDVKKEASKLNFCAEFFRSNSESEIIEKIHSLKSNSNKGSYKAIIINAGAFTHTSIAIHDALKIVNIPVIEVHISNIYQREEFRHKSYISPIAKGVICGFGAKSYILAVHAAANC